jgi:hypothetical protein
MITGSDYYFCQGHGGNKEAQRNLCWAGVPGLIVLGSLWLQVFVLCVYTMLCMLLCALPGVLVCALRCTLLHQERGHVTVPANIDGQHVTVNLAKVEGVRTFPGVCMGIVFYSGGKHNNRFAAVYCLG